MPALRCQPLFVFMFLSLPVLLPAQANSSARSVSWLDSFALAASSTVARTENISRTFNAPNRKDATTYDVTVNGGTRRQVSGDTMLGLAADVGAVWEPSFDRNNRSFFGARTNAQLKFGLGPFAPVLQGDIGLTYQATRLGSARGITTDCGLRASKRIHPAVRMSVFARWTDHAARSPTFDTTQFTSGIDVTWDFAEQWSLSASAGWQDGDVVANASPLVWAAALADVGNPRATHYYRSVDREVTELYGPGWVSYKNDVRTDLWSAALGYRASTGLTLELRLSGLYVVNRVDASYPSRSWGLSASWHF
ncbi:MAG: hypothetical protein KBA71_11430 [Opitutaceae bacterium]|nr:hypothetical protein [Opitutaceae bacterium]